MARKFRAFARENIYKKVYKSTSRQRRTTARINSTPEIINSTVENVSVIERLLQQLSDEGLLDQTDASAGSNSVLSEENYQVHTFPEGAQEDDEEQGR